MDIACDLQNTVHFDSTYEWIVSREIHEIRGSHWNKSRSSKLLCIFIGVIRCICNPESNDMSAFSRRGVIRMAMKMHSAFSG